MAGVKTMGTTLTLEMAGSETEDTVLAHIASIGEQATEAEEVDVTTLDSPGGNKEFVQGAKDPGSVDLEINNLFDGQVEVLKAIFDAGTVRSWTETFKTGNTLAYDAYISAFKFGEATTDGLHKVSLTLRVTGAPVYTEAA